jgi:hypothetical protein
MHTFMANREPLDDGEGALYRPLAKRLDRSGYTLKAALNEINLAEFILDNMGAAEGKTLWGRIASIKNGRS